MAYNRENLLKRIIKIQDRVLENQKKGISQKWTYENDISDIIADISYPAFNKYLAIPAKVQLKELLLKQEQKKEIEKLQLKLF